MPTSSKGIKTSVKLDVKDAEKKLKLLEKRIAKIQLLIGNSGTTAGKFSRHITKAYKDMQKLDSANHRAANSANKMANGYKSAAKQTSVLTKNLRALASTYIGIMGLKAVATASDTITSAENKLNNLPGGSPASTKEAMDKMYAAAQRSRTDYAGMMTNVSKTMTLAPDAFQGEIDNAIRFQEIMAKAYTVGGASAAEQHSSMYQLVQALGSGILQGDELRSIREGAPIAYQKIEEFAQGVYGAEENLKDLASQGKITSEIVVAAIMDAGTDIDDAFANTQMTFAQAMTSIKNMALQTFTPVLQMLNRALNSGFGKAVITGIGVAFQVIAKILTVVFGLINHIYNFIINNSKIVLSILSVIGVFLGAYLVNQVRLLTAALLKMVYQAAVNLVVMVGQFIAMGNALGYATAMSIMFGVTLNMWALVAIAVLALIVVAIVWVSDSFVDACGNIVGVVMWALSVIGNVFIGVINALIQSFYTMFIEPIASLVEWVVNAFSDGFDNIDDAFVNLLGNMLSLLVGFAKPAAKLIDAIFGTNTNGILEDAQASLKSWGKKENAVTYKVTAPELKRFDNTDAFDFGHKIGAGAGQWMSDKVSSLGSMATDPAYAVGGAYNPEEALNSLDGIEGNTGDMADSMALADEDLEYLRRVADMEWKKEFTTANITVDMSNYNTIGGDADLDGIVTRLSDKLYEELDAVANGVYV